MQEDPRNKHDLSELLVHSVVSPGKNWAGCSAGAHHLEAAAGSEEKKYAWLQPHQ